MAVRSVISKFSPSLLQSLVKRSFSFICQNENFLCTPFQFLNYKYPLLTNNRLKSKTSSTGKHRIDTDELKSLINDNDIKDDFSRVRKRLDEDIFRKLCLKLTPDHFFNIVISKDGVRLGEVASIISQTSIASSTSQPSAQVLIDMSGRPDLVSAARNSVSKFLSEEGTGLSKKNSTSSDLIQIVDQTQFTVRLRTIVTGDIRKELVKQGREMLTRTKKEMDKIYQKYSRALNSPAMKTISEDKKRLANDYLKALVKTEHTLADETWQKKEQELLNE